MLGIEESNEAVRAFIGIQENGLISGAAAVGWVSDHPRFAAVGKPARAKLWKACDAPSSTGRVTAKDVDRWLRAVLGCPERFVSRPTVQRLFEAAKDGLRPGKAEVAYLEPGIGWWRVLLLVHCYCQLYLHFQPDEGSTFVEQDDFVAMATYLRRWGVYQLTVEQANAEFERIDFEYGHAVFFHEQLDWAMQRLLRNRTGSGFPFKELERHLTGVGQRNADLVPTELRPAATPRTPRQEEDRWWGGALS